jgi:hypothetical protein
LIVPTWSTRDAYFSVYAVTAPCAVPDTVLVDIHVAPAVIGSARISAGGS